MTDQPDDNFPDGPKRTRLEDEVLEILHRVDRPPTSIERARASRRAASQGAARRANRYLAGATDLFDSGTWFVAFIALSVLAYAIEGASDDGARFLALAAVFLLVGAIIHSLRRPRRRGVKQWRGRDIDLNPPGRPLWLDRLIKGAKRPPRR